MSHNAISPLDGRYSQKTAPLTGWFSESALIRQRIKIELEWLKTIAPLLSPGENNSAAAVDDLQKLSDNINAAAQTDAAVAEIKSLEETTRHDVKAVEYWLAKQLQKRGQKKLRPLLHFACTSWDINNLAQSLMINGAMKKIMSPQLSEVIISIRARAKEFAAIAMLSRTHGQPASPTTMGKEFANFAMRLTMREKLIRAHKLNGKMNGASGNYNAHRIACPKLNWQKISRRFVESQGLQFNSHTTQIEPYDSMADLFDHLRRVNVILIGFCRDMWAYISMDYFTQKTAAGEIGSSTMPHKINPIDFENAEGNLGIANAMLAHFSDKLPISRLQRDLSDSTVTRNIGAAFAHTFLAWQSACAGIDKLLINEKKLTADLDDNWQVLTEAAQTMSRLTGEDDAFEKLKTFSRGNTVNKKQMRAFIEQLNLPTAAKNKLLNLTPNSYTGLAAKLARDC